MNKPSVHIFFVNVGMVWEELSAWRVLWLADERYQVAAQGARAPGMPTGCNRNLAVKRFLEHGSDYMLMIDDDTVPTANVLDLVEYDLDITVFPTPMFRPREGDYPIFFNVELLGVGGEDEQFVLRDPKPLMEVVGGGSGCILIARRVLEHPAMRAPFLDDLDPDGVQVASHDVEFIRRARMIGFRAWAAMEYPCSHIKSLDLLLVSRIYQRLINQARGE